MSTVRQPDVEADLTQEQAVAWAETQVSPRPRTKGILQLLREALDPEKLAIEGTAGKD